MEFSTLRTSTFPTALIFSIGAFASRGTLKADGIIRVKGADITTASITVVLGNAASYTLPVSAKHVTLDLPLDDVYLISVQRDGCPTKEVYFDTRVPVEMHAHDFDFPFMVSLEHLSPERMFTYAAPVGFVRYVHGLKDFGYETQYLINVEEELKERMKTIRDTGVDPKVMAPIAAAMVLDRPRAGYSAPLGIEEVPANNVAPLVSEVPELVHVVNAPSVAIKEASVRPAEALFMEPISAAASSGPLPPRVPASAQMLPIGASRVAATRSTRPKVDPVVATVVTAPAPER